MMSTNPGRAVCNFAVEQTAGSRSLAAAAHRAGVRQKRSRRLRVYVVFAQRLALLDEAYRHGRDF
jgi:hypothetical protein